MIPDWRGALRTAARFVRPGGFIHVVDFGDLRALWPVAAKFLRAWLRSFHVAPRDELLLKLEARAHERQDCTLHVLPGRYAFVLKAIPRAIEDLAG